MFETTFLFPSEQHDHTYRVLRRSAMRELVRRVEGKFGLHSEALGRIDRY